MASFEFAGKSVFFRADDASNEPETLLLIPGLGGTAAFWDTVWPLLAQRYRLISFDHPGMGSSADPDESPSVNQLADLSVALLTHVGAERAVLVGHSMGGAIAQTVAIDSPARVRALVLSSTWAQPDHYFRKAFAQRKMLLEQCGADAYARAQTLSAMPPAWIAANPQAADAQERRAKDSFRNPDVLAQRIDAVVAFDRNTELNQINVPTLVAYSNGDAVVPPHMSIDLLQRVPGAKALELFDAGHFAPVVKPQEFANGVLAFVDSLASQ